MEMKNELPPLPAPDFNTGAGPVNVELGLWNAASVRAYGRECVAAVAPAGAAKLVLALPDYETRRIVIASDEIIDGERVVCVAIKAAQAAPVQPEPQADIAEMVNRFLGWPLPLTVCSDLCATMQGIKHRSGTNLLNADEAKAMLEYVLAALSPADGVTA